MDIRQLAEELADIQVECAYTFENGTPFRQRLGFRRAEAVLTALQARGYSFSRPHIEAPSICDA